MRTITYFPLWLMMLYWLLWNTGKTKAEKLSALESAHRITLLEYLLRSLPIPRNWLERKTTTYLMTWIDREIHRAATRPVGISPKALRLVTVKKG